MLDCDFVHLNLGGLAVTYDNLMLIKKKFINLKSLSIANNNIGMEAIIEFLKPPEKKLSDGGKEEEDTYYQQLEFIDLSHNRNITRWTIDNPMFLNCSPSLMAFEFSIKIINDLDTIGGELNYRTSEGIVKWKTYDSLGRRGWLYKVDERNPDNSKKIGLTMYDVETGEKILQILRLPVFLKMVNKKISLSQGVLNDADEYGDFERGIYKYYGMKMWKMWRREDDMIDDFNI